MFIPHISIHIKWFFWFKLVPGSKPMLIYIFKDTEQHRHSFGVMFFGHLMNQDATLFIFSCVFGLLQCHHQPLYVFHPVRTTRCKKKSENLWKQLPLQIFPQHTPNFSKTFTYNVLFHAHVTPQVHALFSATGSTSTSDWRINIYMLTIALNKITFNTLKKACQWLESHAQELAFVLGVCLFTFNKASRRHNSFLCFRVCSARPSPSTQPLLFCQELLCFPEERKLFHFHLLSASECERRSFSNIHLFKLPSPS